MRRLEKLWNQSEAHGDVMQSVALGDVIFIILVLGVIHGIMHLVALARKRKSRSGDDSARPN